MINIPPFKKESKFKIPNQTNVYDQFQLRSSQRKAEVKIVTQTVHHKKPASGAISVDRGAENL